MVIATTSASVSPRPRRASAPLPPSSALRLHKQYAGSEGEGRQRQEAGGPTLDQCLVLPAGLALEIDGLLSSSPADLGIGRESDGGGGGGGASPPAVPPEGKGSLEGGDGDRGHSSPGAGRGDDRAIISSYHFETSSTPAAADAQKEESGQSDEMKDVRDYPVTEETAANVDRTPVESDNAAADGLAKQDVPEMCYISSSGGSSVDGGSGHGSSVSGGNGKTYREDLESASDIEHDNGEGRIGIQVQGLEAAHLDPPTPSAHVFPDGEASTGAAPSGSGSDEAAGASAVIASPEADDDAAAIPAEEESFVVPGSDDTEAVVGTTGAVSDDPRDSSSSAGMGDVVRAPMLAQVQLEAREVRDSTEACSPGGYIDPVRDETVAVFAGGIAGSGPSAGADEEPSHEEVIGGEGEVMPSMPGNSLGEVRSAGSVEGADFQGGAGVSTAVDSTVEASLPVAAAAAAVPVEFVEEAVSDVEGPFGRHPDKGGQGEEEEASSPHAAAAAAAHEEGCRRQDVPCPIGATVSNSPTSGDTLDVNEKAGGSKPAVLETGVSTSTVAATLASSVASGSSDGSTSTDGVAERDALVGDGKPWEMGAADAGVGEAVLVDGDAGERLVARRGDRNGDDEHRCGRGGGVRCVRRSGCGRIGIRGGRGRHIGRRRERKQLSFDFSGAHSSDLGGTLAPGRYGRS
ncbi:unnamed protein product [Scytosiphon promiscuus]